MTCRASSGGLRLGAGFVTLRGIGVVCDTPGPLLPFSIGGMLKTPSPNQSFVLVAAIPAPSRRSISCAAFHENGHSDKAQHNPAGSLVICTIAAGGTTKARVILRVFWASYESAVAIALLHGGGLAALQAMVCQRICRLLWSSSARVTLSCAGC